MSYEELTAIATELYDTIVTPYGTTEAVAEYDARIAAAVATSSFSGAAYEAELKKYVRGQ